MFYLISTQIMNDNTKAQSIAAYEELNVAESAYHSTMASNYISETIKTCACMVVDDFGSFRFKKYLGDDKINDQFYVVSLQDTGEANPCSITAKDDENDALSTMEMTLASNCLSETLVSSACFVINKIGGKIDGGFTQTEEPEPEPEA